MIAWGEPECIFLYNQLALITCKTRDDCSLNDFYKLGFLGFRLQTRVSDKVRARDRERARARARAILGLGFKVVIICGYAL